MKLSILIPSVSSRRNTFLPTSLDMLYGQLELLSDIQQKEVEILYLVDNKTMMLGHKRNCLIDISQGKYITFVDDDDRISDDYITELLTAIETDADAINFDVSVSLNGEEPKITKYSKDYPNDYNTDDNYFRLPNHICCIKREVSLNTTFPNIAYAEDSAYSKLLRQHIKTEYQINKVLYYYDFNSDTTETQQHLKNKIRTRQLKPIVDVIILANAKTPQLEAMTNNTILSCLSGANELPINIIVIEQNENVKYPNATTIHKTGDFNYNGSANFGAQRGSSEWIMIANNDLIFKNGWLHSLLAAGHPLVSPKHSRHPRQKDIIENTEGVDCGTHFSGWCFMIKRELWKVMGGFDECVNFWFSDNCVIEQVLKLGVTPMLVPSSIVEHLVSTTLKGLGINEQDDFTWAQCDIFNQKYGKDLFNDNHGYKLWKEKFA